MAKVYISEALQIVTDKVDGNDIETANKMLAVISKGIARQRIQKQNTRIIELTTKQDIKYFERILVVEKQNKE